MSEAEGGLLWRWYAGVRFGKASQVEADLKAIIDEVAAR